MAHGRQSKFITGGSTAGWIVLVLEILRAILEVFHGAGN